MSINTKDVRYNNNTWQEVWQASGDGWMLCHPAVKISSPPYASPTVKQSAFDCGLAEITLKNFNAKILKYDY